MEENFVSKVIDNINKEYGEGIILTLNNTNKDLSGKFLSTGSFIFDYNTMGGYSFGRIVEIFGHESSGKSTLALHAVSECQKAGKTAAYIDLENSLSIEYAESIGIDKNKLIIAYPKYGEEALDLIVSFIKNGIDLIILDSVSALVSKSELESSFDRQQTIGLKARMMSTALPKINNALTNSNSVVIFINQLRNKINTMSYFPGGQTTTGGLALHYFSSLRVSVRKTEEIKKDSSVIGIKVETKIVKNKVYSPQKNFQLEIIFGKGIIKKREIFYLAEKEDLIQKSGNWYSYKNERLGNGKESSISYLENYDLFPKIEKELFDKLKNC